ncbi:hypothetical protein [Undibacterium sp.]|uniref:hypothetical protein n=1 Tax=Undibacterium sp. TaxID=1914977 RepID=UPI00374D4187
MITQQQARDMLDEVARTQQRSRHYLGYWRYGIYAQMWGVLWIVAHLGSFFRPQQMGMIWTVCDIIGITGSVALHLRGARNNNDSNESSDGEGGNNDHRRLWAMLIILVFGMLASMLIGPKPRAIEVFWTCLVMTGYMVGGLWAGLRWTVLGAAVCVICLVSSILLAPWYDLVMAFAGGGGLLLGGTWLRRAG